MSRNYSLFGLALYGSNDTDDDCYESMLLGKSLLLLLELLLLDFKVLEKMDNGTTTVDASA